MQMPKRSTRIFPIPIVLVVLVVVLQVVSADVYMHAPRGSNNKLNEVANTVQNDKRLFDSQNNGNAGYQVGDNCQPVCSDSNGNYDRTKPGAAEGSPYFYVGSQLYLEWSVQHACSSPHVHCEVILQYMCSDSSPGIRDGKVTTTIPNDATTSEQPQYGQHETYQYYQQCTQRERNKGLFLADQFSASQQQQLRSAIYTRQDRTGTRYGFECPEERDYYPYWHPTPWRDIAVFTDSPARCGLYTSESQNRRNKGLCSLAQYNNKAACETAQGSWTESGAFNTAPPACHVTQWARDNHHGNTMSGMPWSYNWTVSADVMSEKCVLRVRYNISTGDFDGWSTDAAFNNERSPVRQDLTADFIGLGAGTSGPLRLGMNTDQYGRTFEDRSHTFAIRARPSSIAARATIYNIGVRGRRGNIQQVAPVVEYDFVPNILTVRKGDYVHFQFVGSDANPAGNDGEGRRMTDRSNLVQVTALDRNIPTTAAQHTLFSQQSHIVLMARLGQTNCDETTNDEQNVRNCKLLNAAPGYFDSGLIMLENTGTHFYINSRNNQFSNRSQKGAIIVTPDWPLIIGVAVGGTGFIAVVIASCLLMRWYAMTHPSSKIALGCCGRCLLGHRRYQEVVSAASGLAVQPPVTPAGKRYVVRYDYEAGDADELTVCADDTVFALSDVTPEGWIMVVLDKGGKSGYVPSTYIEEASAHSRPASGIKPRRRSIKKAGQVRLWWHHHRRNFWFLTLFSVINAILYAYGFISNMSAAMPIWFPLAKGSGQVLNFNCALILFPVMRSVLSWLRTTPVVEIIELDNNITFHKIVACTISIFACAHIVFHYLDFVVFSATLGTPIVNSALSNLAGVTGHLVVLLMLLMFCSACECVRARRCCGIGGYTIFWVFHRLYIPVVLLMFIHSPRYWMWAFFPVCLMFMEYLIRRRHGKHPMELIRVVQEESDVLRIELRKHNFHYKPGQYLFLNCEEVSKNEWHPFTITSAPEQQILSVHVRCRGDWTSKLQSVLNPDKLKTVEFAASTPSVAGPVTPRSATVKAAVALERSTAAPLLRAAALRVDGPYGAASEHVFDHNTVMLVGAGIGVTPFASIMKSIRMRVRALRCSHCGSADDVDNVIKPQRVYFYWMCRDEQEFSWFKSLLQGIEADASVSTVFQFNTFLTGEVDLSAMMAKYKSQDAFRIAYAGRPNWRRIFRDMQQKHPRDDIGVFLCGPQIVADELSDVCQQFTQPSGTRFTFRKENF
eukprot:TRINITY_DN9426_c0_g2_i2.p1 TRINITY_DN9426_c0_g2~~TRINITY_DN9426_c0_g2_i2.p1  ORF type:complete len:1237 (+),score=274.54 TRINITY_DN9426_c0_g2_i2:345-4055(+)